VARIRLAYIGGGSTRAPGTMASLIAQAEQFAGSEIVLIDLDADRLALVQKLAQRLAEHHGADLTVTTTTDRAAGLADCDYVLTSFRPGGFEARYLDERIPLDHGMIGQETQGIGGFFMALRSVAVMKEIIADLERVAPRAMIVNYTNPVNLVAQAVTTHSDMPFVSLCEGPLYSPAELASAIGLDPALLDVRSIGLNHASWSVHHTYDGEDFISLLEDAQPRFAGTDELTPRVRRMLNIAVATGHVPSEYAQYYFYTDEILADLTSRPTTRAQDIMARVPDYWAHYREQAELPHPELDPARSRGGINELELALDLIAAIANNTPRMLPVNVPNRGAIPDLPDDQVVETFAQVDAAGIFPLALGPLPHPVAGLVQSLAEYQLLAGQAAWEGTRRDAIRALLANPLCRNLEQVATVYDALASAHRQYLPERLLRN
jgi:6-phospho-beta-glucosidase